jgi:hypothetical protein
MQLTSWSAHITKLRRFTRCSSGQLWSEKGYRVLKKRYRMIDSCAWDVEKSKVSGVLKVIFMTLARSLVRSLGKGAS